LFNQIIQCRSAPLRGANRPPRSQLQAIATLKDLLSGAIRQQQAPACADNCKSDVDEIQGLESRH
jgi:hypothetical protein